jgi:hypothetical protein
VTWPIAVKARQGDKEATRQGETSSKRPHYKAPGR